MSIEPRARVAPERVLPVLTGPVPMAPETAAQQKVVQRICARVAPQEVEVGVGELPPGGLQVWIEAPVHVDPRESWVLHHRMAREVGLVGWHCEADSDRLLVLGWSAACLHNRIRLLQSGLDRLSSFEHTAQRAVQLEGEDPRGRPAADVAAAACAAVGRRLRWPERLAELDGFDRSSGLPHLQLLLAQVIGLESKVSSACEDHLIMARVLARAVCEHYAAHGDLPRAQREVLAENRRWVHASTFIRGTATVRPAGAPRPHMGLAERRIAASVINHGVPRATPAAVTPRTGHQEGT
ncbi:hypothetical protein ACIBIZ_22785 [Nonomuraea spiralis]|uniref:Uncharacterized protein n=1 Tax=Nonomuraea spiralis TaxID=46182 RepID=A0ABV5I5D9_9ACTN|nr:MULTISPECIES: hypothetical protein [Nonomuraea]RSN06721.1 hypothetical protein DMB42_26045 [Nonomuraea sp. WAC 01424]GGS63410.1 hypothetical protein GCM10010176_002030 [Nonomuraea spiralis]